MEALSSLRPGSGGSDRQTAASCRAVGETFGPALGRRPPLGGQGRHSGLPEQTGTQDSAVKKRTFRVITYNNNLCIPCGQGKHSGLPEQTGTQDSAAKKRNSE